MDIDQRLPTSLRTQLLISILVLLLLILSAGSFLTYVHAVSKVETEMRAAITVGARIVRNAIDDFGETADPRRRLELLVADFEGDRHVRAFLTEADGHIAVVSRVGAPEERVPHWFYRLVGGRKQTFRVPLPQALAGHGAFMLETDSHNEVAEVWSDIGLTLTILVSFCTLLGLLVYVTLGRALRPLEQLSEAFLHVGADADVPHLAERGPIELARVYRGFNRMIDQLKKVEVENLRLEEQLATVQEEERAEIARDLHDEIGPFLFAVDVDAMTIEQSTDRKAFDEIAPRVQMMRVAIKHMQRHVREILMRLQPTAVHDLGLAEAIQNLVFFWQARRPELLIHVDVLNDRFGEPLDGIAYRIIQESLNNAVRHGSPGVIEIIVHKTDENFLSICVSDDGKGLPTNLSSAGFGISGMQQRVSALGGTVEVRNRDDRHGTIMSAQLPIPSSSLIDKVTPLFGKRSQL